MRTGKSAILAQACAAAGLTPDEATGPCQRHALARRRFHVMAILRARGWSLPAIGQLLNRDHTTVLHGLRRHAGSPPRDRTHG